MRGVRFIRPNHMLREGGWEARNISDVVIGCLVIVNDEEILLLWTRGSPLALYLESS